jgi:hypothetical protein
METQQKSVSSSYRLIQNIYLSLAGLILLGIFVQGFLIGASIFGVAVWGQRGHGTLGLVLVVLALLLPLTSLFMRLPGIIKGMSWLLLVLMVVQFILPSFSSNIPLISALHPANATLLFGVDVLLIILTVQFMRNK